MNPNKSCGDCTACCEGWLEGSAHGKPYYPGNPCYFKETTCCSIYKDRPPECVAYKCEWLKRDEFPLWMKPHESGILLTEEIKNGIKYFIALETSKEMDISSLNFLLRWAVIGRHNLEYYVRNGRNLMGSPEFVSLYIARAVE